MPSEADRAAERLEHRRSRAGRVVGTVEAEVDRPAHGADEPGDGRHVRELAPDLHGADAVVAIDGCARSTVTPTLVPRANAGSEPLCWAFSATWNVWMPGRRGIRVDGRGLEHART